MTVENHKDAIKNIQADLKILAEKKREIRKQILGLKYNEAGERRADTGPERDALWNSYQWPCRTEARHANLAIGLLRGRSYESLEPKSTEPVHHPRILNLLRKAFNHDKEQLAEWTIGRLFEWAKRTPSVTDEAA